MANKTHLTTDGGAQYLYLDTTESDIVLGDAHRETGSTWVLQLEPSGALGTGGIVVKDRLTGAPDNFSWRTPPVYGPDSDTEIAGGTVLQDAGKYYVVCDGSDLRIDYTQDTGSLEVAARPLQG